MKLQCVTIDCHDPRALAEFWSAVLDWEITDADDEGVVIELLDGSPAQGVIPDILFYKNPDRKTVKNRMHFDLRPANQAQEVARVEALGGKRIEIGQSEHDGATWVVMADPEGNEFCILKDLA